MSAVAASGSISGPSQDHPQQTSEKATAIAREVFAKLCRHLPERATDTPESRAARDGGPLSQDGDGVRTQDGSSYRPSYPPAGNEYRIFSGWEVAPRRFCLLCALLLPVVMSRSEYLPI
jgi:hypothetical protein